MQTDRETPTVGDTVTNRSRDDGGRSRGWDALSVLPLWFMAALVLATYAGIVWTLRRGFDWTDESFVDTMIASNRMAVGEAWGFQHLLHPLYVLTGESVLAFRIVRLAGYVLLSVALVWSGRAIVRRIGISIVWSGWAFVILLAQVGTFLAWSYPPRYVGYNELASWFAQLGVALVLISLAWGVSSPGIQRSSRVLWTVWAVLGAIAILLVFAKVTSAVAFAAVLALALCVPNPHLRLWKRVVSIGAGATAMLLVLWASRVPIGFYLENAYSLVFDKSERETFGRPLSPMIHMYGISFLSTGRALLPTVLLFALAMASFRWKARPPGAGARGVAIDRVSWLLGALLLIALFSLPRINVWSYLGELVTFIGAAGIIGLSILGTDGATMHGSAVSRSLSVALGGLAIVGTPFMSALGTSNPIMGQLMWSASLWLVVLGIALVLLTQRAAHFRSNARSLPMLIGCVVILLAALAVKADIAKPYKNAPLLSQETSTSVPELRGLLLTQTDAAWIDWVSAAGDSLRGDNVPAIAINSRVGHDLNTSGALYAFNHSGYANPWLGIEWPTAFNSLRLACTMHPPTDLFVLQPGMSTEHAPSTSGVAKNLAACGIDFPKDFRVVATRVSGDPWFAMTIWRLNDGAQKP